MATGTTSNYLLPYPLSTDPVRVAGDIEQLAKKIDNDLQEIIEDKSASMWTGGTFNNGLSAPTYNDTTGKMSMSLAQDLRTTATPTFTGVNLVGGDLYLGPSRSIIFEGSSDDAFETTLIVTDPTADRTITFQNGSGTVPFASDVHFIGTTSIALNRASAAQSLTGITSIDGSAARLTTGRTIGMTGDVSWTSASFDGSGNVTGTSTISNSAVTYAKIQNLSAQYRVLGRISASAGVVEELTPDNMITLLNQATSTLSAYAPTASPTFTGSVTIPAPTSNLHAATKLYVDNAVAGVTGALPSQTGNNGRFLTTNGTTASWSTILFSNISTTPTTLSGYGITDAINTSATTQTKSGNLNVVSPTAAGSTGVRQVTMSTANPSGGADGDMWLVYV